MVVVKSQVPSRRSSTGDISPFVGAERAPSSDGGKPKRLIFSNGVFTLVAPKKPNSVSSVVSSPTFTSIGGLLGLFGLAAELSKIASIASFVPRLARLGSLNQYVSCH